MGSQQSQASAEEEKVEDGNEEIKDDPLFKVREKKKVLASIRTIKHKISSKGEIIILDDLERLVNENKFNSNDSNQEIFITGAKLGIGTKEDPLIIVFSSRTCLKYLRDLSQTNLPQFGLDSTFKVNELRYPLTCWAAQDVHHTIYPIALAISNSECEETYKFVLKSIMETYFEIYKVNLTPKYIISDAAEFIFKATKEVFGEMVTHVVCYFHLKQAVKRNFVNHGITKEKRPELLKCIDHLRAMFSKDHFDKYWTLLKAKLC